ncbi:NHLP leader peptide family RiPP precursor [Desulfotignum phosphitoxidans]|uniref:Nitrile hydratase alpha/Thiocyanate hydrolase gamma domain-containing protein n=1 Tax=Desulfotignum phosphitoxidans DSM 13687 TaxID=1286635 RepID=S0FSX8_9BACT|nr:NHLP leader peptide family RiPP precursor [Desulfotignum phosphitoxidans]EMS78178.1 hypothetical protein Dpo_9c00100 [Desulfotignum phosphitoxidans DSM 13687]
MNEEQAKKAQQQWAKIITKARADEDFKVRLIAEPAAVLKEEGIVVPDGITIKVMEDTESVTHVVIPLRSDGAGAENLAEPHSAANTGNMSESDKVRTTARDAIINKQKWRTEP